LEGNQRGKKFYRRQLFSSNRILQTNEPEIQVIPFLDLHTINARFETQFKELFQQFLDSGYYILGNQLTQFEDAFADYCGTKYCIGVGNGLDALRIILESYKALGELKEGDEVLIASNTFIATILAVKQAGLVPVLVETESTTYNFNLHALAKAITPKTKVVMPVHLYGQLAPMDALRTIVSEYELLIIEDAAQAHGATHQNGKRAGNLGHAAGFSFYPSKNLGALGDGGCITTNNSALAKVAKQIRNYGTSSKYVNEHLGINSRLDEIQAGFLHIKLANLDTDNEQRRAVASQYLAAINNPKVILPTWDGSTNHVFHLFVVRVAHREHFIGYLNEHGIGNLIHYPIAPHQQKALAEYKALSFPVAEKIHEQVVSLPMSPVMEAAQINRVIEVINQY